MNENYTSNSTFDAESEYQARISLKWTHVWVTLWTIFFIFTHATRRLTTKINEIYNSDSAFYAESKYQFRISLIWTYACVIHCERMFIFTHSIMRLANNSMKKRIKTFIYLHAVNNFPRNTWSELMIFPPTNFTWLWWDLYFLYWWLRTYIYVTTLLILIEFFIY